MVEADGEWHTSDNKHASDGWRIAHPFVNGTAPGEVSPPHRGRKESPEGSSRASSQEVISLTDSEDDEEGLVKRELSPATSFARSQSQSQPYRNGSGRSTQQAGKSAEVIDLTLDSDDDEPSPSPVMAKRKHIETESPNDSGSTWKKPRFNDTQPASPSASGPYNNYANGSGPPPPVAPMTNDGLLPYSNASSRSPGWTRLPPIPSSSYQPPPPPYRHPTSPNVYSYPPNTGSSRSPPNQGSLYYRPQSTARK